MSAGMDASEWRENGLLVGRLRSQVSELLESTRWQPPACADESILCVRCFRDPRPGLLSAQSALHGLPESWRQAAADALGRQARHAARPVNGMVPANADAVLFADRAEFLACLSHDVLLGNFLDRWWWKLWPESSDPLRFLNEAWPAVPESVPAALQRLVELGILQPFIEVIGSIRAYELLAEVLRRFALADLLPSQNLALGMAHGLHAAEFKHGIVTVAPWKEIVPEAEAIGRSLAAEALVGMGLLLCRAPQRIRSNRFRESLRAFYQPTVISPSSIPIISVQRDVPFESSALPLHRTTDPEFVRQLHGQSISKLPMPDTPQLHRSESVRNLVESVVHSWRIEQLPVATPSRVNGRRRDSSSLVSSARAPKAHVQAQGEPSVVTTDAPPVNADETPRHVSGTPPTRLSVLSWSAADAASDATEPMPISTAKPNVSEQRLGARDWYLETQLGGLFYLINLALYLELYGDFSRPAEPGIDLPIWDFVASVGERLLGEKPADPVWELLASLAERAPDAPPGDGRDLPASWQDFLALFAQERLMRALGLQDARELASVLLRHHARVRVTATRFDVSLSLVELPISVRLAGLDRDPGFVPAAGRHVAFFFD